MAGSARLAKLIIQFEWIAADQFFRPVDADPPQILGASLADVRQVFEFDGMGFVDFLRMHGWSISDVKGLCVR